MLPRFCIADTSSSSTCRVNSPGLKWVEEPIFSRTFLLCVGFSILLHLASFILLAKGGVLSFPQRQNTHSNTQYKVKLLASPEVKKADSRPDIHTKKQIVQPVVKPNLLKPEETHLSSDTDNSVLQEQLKRGQQAKAYTPQKADKSAMSQEPTRSAKGEATVKAVTSPATKTVTDTEGDSSVRPPAPVAKAELARAVEKSDSANRANSANTRSARQKTKLASKLLTPPKSQDTASRKIKSQDSALFLDNSEVAGVTGRGAQSHNRGKTENARQESQVAANLGQGLTDGSNDFLPQVRDGELTMLNTKANLFAPFVRRVAEKVFNELRSRHWSSVGRVDLTKAVKPVTIEAILDENGRLLSVTLRNSSGSVQFDNALESAVNVGAWDRNPPKGALTAERQIHFIFQSQVWSRRVSNRGNDSRWILLGTGLK